MTVFSLMHLVTGALGKGPETVKNRMISLLESECAAHIFGFASALAGGLGLLF